MKHKHTLTKSKTALLVIDVQDKFAPAIPDFDACVTNVTRLVLAFQMFKLPIIVTEQYPEGLGNTVEEIREQFTMLEVVEKIELAATENRQFMEKINTAGCDTFVVCGIETHVCVNQTVLGLLERGKTVHVVVDAVASRHAVDHSTGLRKMENAGALATTTETALFELAERAGTESFKNIQRMVKEENVKTNAPKKAPAAAKAVESKPIPVAESPKPMPAPVPKEAKAVETPPDKGAYNDVADIFDLPGAAALDKKPEKQEEPLDAVDTELASAAKEMHENKPASSGTSGVSTSARKEEPKPGAGVTHSSSDIDTTEAVDIGDMLALIDKKIDVNEPVRAPDAGVDKDTADLDEIIKLEETTKLERPDLKKGRK